MRGTGIVELAEARGVVARHQDKQCATRRSGDAGKRTHRRKAFLDRAARVDHRNGGAARQQPTLRAIGTARGDHAPAGARGQPGQFVTLAKGEQKDWPFAPGNRCGVHGRGFGHRSHS